MVGYIGLGSSEGDRAGHLREGLAGLARGGVTVEAASSLWETEPVDGAGPGWFLNMAVRVRTDLSPEALLDLCLAVERARGRVRRGGRPGPRPLDLDLLVFEGVARATPRLTLPHPRMWERRFVLAPLAELAPEFHEALEALRDPHTVRLYSAAP
jgi:2-amino-4-hydroxy-6-hydroxymethyldihydropteridine diphosphokinase